MGRGDEDGLCADTVHVDAGAALQVVEVDVAVLGDQVHSVMLGAHLLVGRGWWEGGDDKEVRYLNNISKMGVGKGRFHPTLLHSKLFTVFVHTEWYY